MTTDVKSLAVPPRSLHTLDFSEIVKGIAPEKRAAIDMDRCARLLSSVAHNVAVGKHALALTWFREWRLYCFERNRERWPDGRYHLVDRSYQLWRKHDISFTREELRDLGCDEWDRKVVQVAYGAAFVPLEADCFHHQPRRQLKNYAALVKRIADALAARLELREMPVEGEA